MRFPPVDLKSALRLALLTGLGTFVLVLLAYVVASSANSITIGLVTRAVLITALLLCAPHIALRRTSRAVALPTAVVGLAGGHLLVLGGFAGPGYIWRLAVDRPLVAGTVDLLIWMAVGVGSTVMVSHGSGSADTYR